MHNTSRLVYIVIIKFKKLKFDIKRVKLVKLSIVCVYYTKMIISTNTGWIWNNNIHLYPSQYMPTTAYKFYEPKQADATSLICHTTLWAILYLEQNKYFTTEIVDKLWALPCKTCYTLFIGMCARP